MLTGTTCHMRPMFGSRRSDWMKGILDQSRRSSGLFTGPNGATPYYAHVTGWLPWVLLVRDYTPSVRCDLYTPHLEWYVTSSAWTLADYSQLRSAGCVGLKEKDASEVDRPVCIGMCAPYILLRKPDSLPVLITGRSTMDLLEVFSDRDNETQAAAIFRHMMVRSYWLVPSCSTATRVVILSRTFHVLL